MATTPDLVFSALLPRDSSSSSNSCSGTLGSFNNSGTGSQMYTHTNINSGSGENRSCATGTRGYSSSSNCCSGTRDSFNNSGKGSQNYTHTNINSGSGENRSSATGTRDSSSSSNSCSGTRDSFNNPGSGSQKYTHANIYSGSRENRSSATGSGTRDSSSSSNSCSGTLGSFNNSKTGSQEYTHTNIYSGSASHSLPPLPTTTKRVSFKTATTIVAPNPKVSAPQSQKDPKMLVVIIITVMVLASTFGNDEKLVVITVITFMVLASLFGNVVNAYYEKPLAGESADLGGYRLSKGIQDNGEANKAETNTSRGVQIDTVRIVQPTRIERRKRRGRGRGNAQSNAVQETITTNENVVGEDIDESTMVRNLDQLAYFVLIIITIMVLASAFGNNEKLVVIMVITFMVLVSLFGNVVNAYYEKPLTGESADLGGYRLSKGIQDNGEAIKAETNTSRSIQIDTARTAQPTRGRRRGRGRGNAQSNAVQETIITNMNVVGEDIDESTMNESGKERGRGRGNAHVDAVQQTVNAIQQTAITNESVTGEDTNRSVRNESGKGRGRALSRGKGKGIGTASNPITQPAASQDVGENTVDVATINQDVVSSAPATSQNVGTTITNNGGGTNGFSQIINSGASFTNSIATTTTSIPKVQPSQNQVTASATANVATMQTNLLAVNAEGS